MANTIIIKNGNGAPPSNALAAGELGLDTSSGYLYYGIDNNAGRDSRTIFGLPIITAQHSGMILTVSSDGKWILANP